MAKAFRVAAALLLLSGCYLPPLGRQASEKKIASIRIGMPREETQKLFGKPTLLSDKGFAVHEGSRDSGTLIIGLGYSGAWIDLGGKEFRILFAFNERNVVTRYALECGKRGAGDTGVTPDESCGEAPAKPARRMVLPPGKGAPIALALSPDGQRVAVADSGGFVNMVELVTGEEIFRAEQGNCSRIMFSPAGSILVVLGKTVQVLDAATGAKRKDFKAQGDPRCFSVSPDGAEVALGGRDGRVRIWSLATGAERLSFLAHEDGVKDVVFSPDGQRVATSGWPAAVRIWDATSGAPLFERRRNDRRTYLRLAFSPAGDTLALQTIDHAEIWRVGDTATLEEVFLLPVYRPISGVPSFPRAVDPGLHFSPDGKMIAAGNGILIVYDLTAHQPLWRSPSPLSAAAPGAIADAAFEPGGKRLVTAGEDGVFMVDLP